MEAVMKTRDFAQIGKAVQKFYPHLIEEIKPRLIRPEPKLFHFQHLPYLMKRFSEIKGLKPEQLEGAYNSRDITSLRMLFIGVLITLYCPDVLTGIHRETIKDSLRNELARLFKVTGPRISNLTLLIKSFLNPNKNLASNEDFKNEVYEISKILEAEFAN